MEVDLEEVLRWAKRGIILVPVLWWLLGRAREATRRPAIELEAGEQPEPRPIEPR
jgi:hypothetical protein